jgi:hypothetical protein
MDSGGKINNKNLMFSIENLAVRVISKEGVGIIDDEYGSQIPVCEVGPFNGRIMWFPPYNMEVNETATAKFESTVMVGRNEPMYNYQNSERSANLNFTLLIDYPPQVRNYKDSKNPQKDIAEFFQFGGDDIPYNTYTPNIEQKIRDNEEKKKKIKEGGTKYEYIQKVPRTYYMYFPNDVPVESKINTVVDDMYRNLYEVGKNVISDYSNTYGDLNKSIYLVISPSIHSISVFITADINSFLRRRSINNINFASVGKNLIPHFIVPFSN